MTWKVYVVVKGESDEATITAPEFTAEEAAVAYARGLPAQAWFVIEGWRLDGRPSRIPMEQARDAAIRFGLGEEEIS